MKRGAMHCMHFFDTDTCHLSSLNGWARLEVCVSEKRPPPIGLITLAHFVAFLAASFSQKLQATVAAGDVFNPVTQTGHMGRMFFSISSFLVVMMTTPTPHSEHWFLLHVIWIKSRPQLIVYCKDYQCTYAILSGGFFPYPSAKFKNHQ